MKPLECMPHNATTFSDWLKNRGGLLVWDSVNLSNLGVSWTTPALTDDGKPYGKPSWQAANEPSRHITDPQDVVVIISKEVKRFHVATRMSSQGLSVKVTDGGARRIRSAVAKAEEQYGNAWYEFDYGDYKNAVIMAEVSRQPLTQYFKEQADGS